MSDLTSHTRDDLVELPSDCEPSSHVCTPRYGPNGKRCWCQPRSLLTAQLEVSLIRLRSAEVISLAHARAALAMRRRG
jgi:hypothetical protein